MRADNRVSSSTSRIVMGDKGRGGRISKGRYRTLRR
jgi:hypothetical protein